MRTGGTVCGTARAGATVYLAHGLKHNRRVALKVLKPELAAVVGGDRFIRETRTTANLQQPGMHAATCDVHAQGFVLER